MDGLAVHGRVVLTEFDESTGAIKRQWVEHNTITNWTRALLASFLMGTIVNIGSGSSIQPSLPTYIALGTGTGTASQNDQAMFAETYLTRKQYTYRDILQAYYAQTQVSYTSTDPNGTYTEVGIWDQGTTSLTLSSAVTVGATSLPLSGSTPSMYIGQQVYISDGTNSEYATVSNNYAAGATAWSIKSGLKYAHASGVTVVAFSGNLLGHLTLQQSATITTGQTLSAQYQIYVTAG